MAAIFQMASKMFMFKNNISFFAADYGTIKHHIYEHFEKTKIIICPATACTKIFSTSNSYRVHRLAQYFIFAKNNAMLEASNKFGQIILTLIEIFPSN
jgi:hypothetical protein